MIQIPKMSIDIGMIILLSQRIVLNQWRAKEIGFNLKREDDRFQFKQKADTVEFKGNFEGDPNLSLGKVNFGDR